MEKILKSVDMLPGRIVWPGFNIFYALYLFPPETCQLA